jgi:multidrug efflux pump subunit AcrA (membrane-fusion protein)
MKTMKNKTVFFGAAAIAAVFVAVFAAAAADDKAPPPVAASAPVAKSALTVTATTPQSGRWPITVSANGNVMAW